MESISCVDFCRTLADDTRQAILALLLEKGEMSVGDIVDGFDSSQPTISHHLGVLKSMALVHSRKEGKQVLYSINQDGVQECCGLLLAKFSCDEKA